MSVLLEEALKLPVTERIQLANKLYESVEGMIEQPFSLTDEQVAELERRMEDHRMNPESGIPWEVVRERLFNRK
jgi:putative addiction module component (TIGR02574 family)